MAAQLRLHVDGWLLDDLDGNMGTSGSIVARRTRQRRSSLTRVQLHHLFLRHARNCGITG